MTTAYDPITAYHYSAFRPMLHRPILSGCIREGIEFGLGLDIGCGTGQSSVALAEYCKKVVAIDPSAAMLEKAIAHPEVIYHLGDGENLDFKANHFDIVTFAGSLYYAKSQKLLDEIIRVSKPSAKIIVYDFEILLVDILAKLNVSLDNKKDIPYNHQEDFSGLQEKTLKCIDVAMEEISFAIRPADLGHLILSEKSTYGSLISNLGDKGLYGNVKKRLVELSGGEDHQVKAHLFYSIYECDENKQTATD